MNFLLLSAFAGLLNLIPIEKVTRDPEDALIGRFVGTSAYVPEDPADQGYADTINIWFIFGDSIYHYGRGDTLPDPDGLGEGGGPYEMTDSTVSLNGAYPKILWPAIVLRGTFDWEFVGDTLVITQSTGDTFGMGHMLRLVRR